MDQLTAEFHLANDIEIRPESFSSLSLAEIGVLAATGTPEYNPAGTVLAYTEYLCAAYIPPSVSCSVSLLDPFRLKQLLRVRSNCPSPPSIGV
jgi:hypothetical protein